MRAAPGFSLTELLVAITILFILAALSLVGFSAFMERALSTKCLNNLRQVGASLFSCASDHQNAIPTAYNDREPGNHPNYSWGTRLIKEGYIDNLDILFCPAFFPRNNMEAVRNPTNTGAVQSYRMRQWTAPGGSWNADELAYGWHQLAAIASPSTFFIVADSFWDAPGWMSQGYKITPALNEHRVHLRHRGAANALFADGHVEPKNEEYFRSLSLPDAEGGQRAYTGGREKEIYTITLEQTSHMPRNP